MIGAVLLLCSGDPCAGLRGPSLPDPRQSIARSDQSVESRVLSHHHVRRRYGGGDVWVGHSQYRYYVSVGAVRHCHRVQYHVWSAARQNLRMFVHFFLLFWFQNSCALCDKRVWLWLRMNVFCCSVSTKSSTLKGCASKRPPTICCSASQVCALILWLLVCCGLKKSLRCVVCRHIGCD